MAKAETAQSYTEDLGKLVLRVTLGVLILLHGIGKVISGPDSILAMVANAGLPEAIGYLVYVGEVIAPLLMIAGLWTRAAAVLVAGNMVVAIALVNAREVFALSDMGGWAIELEGMYLFAAIAVALLGAGRISIGGRNGRWN